MDSPTIKTENFNAIPSADPGAAFRMGGEILRLEDRTTGYPAFGLFEHFVRWLMEENPRRGQALQLYYSDTEILAYDVEDLAKFSRDAHPMAKMSFQDHPVLQRLKSAMGGGKDQNEMEKWMLSMRRYLADEGAHYLLLKVRDLQLAKRFTMERKRTPTGWAVAMKCEGGDEGDFIPPETVKFAVPLFRGMEERGTFELDFVFDFEVGVETTKTTWRLSCPTWQEDYLSIATQVIEQSIAAADLKIPVFAGQVKLDVKDDSWSFLHNKLDGLRKLGT